MITQSRVRSILKNDHGYDVNHLNGIIDLTDKGQVLYSPSYNGPYGLDGWTIIEEKKLLLTFAIQI